MKELGLNQCLLTICFLVVTICPQKGELKESYENEVEHVPVKYGSKSKLINKISKVHQFTGPVQNDQGKIMNKGLNYKKGAIGVKQVQKPVINQKTLNIKGSQRGGHHINSLMGKDKLISKNKGTLLNKLFHNMQNQEKEAIHQMESSHFEKPEISHHEAKKSEVSHEQHAIKELEDDVSEAIGPRPIQDAYGGPAVNAKGFDLTDEEIKKFNIWPYAVIPYYVDDVSFDNVLSRRIVSILEDVSQQSALKFSRSSQPLDEKSRWVLFINRKGALNCEDYNYKSFTSEGVQKVVVGYDCLTTPSWLSSVALALAGVPPQHNAPDRDEYITVQVNNIIPDKKHLFDKVSNNEWLFFDLPYDYNSVSHYGTHKHTLNGTATIVPKGKYHNFGENFNGLTDTDIEKLRMLYNYISKKNNQDDKVCKNMLQQNLDDGYEIVFNKNNIDAEPRKKPNRYLGNAGEKNGHDAHDEEINDEDHEEFTDEENHDKHSNIQDDDEKKPKTKLSGKLKHKKSFKDQEDFDTEDD